VREEKLSLEYARDNYGVIVDPEQLAVDRVGTDRLRRERRGRNLLEA